MSNVQSVVRDHRVPVSSLSIGARGGIGTISRHIALYDAIARLGCFDRCGRAGMVVAVLGAIAWSPAARAAPVTDYIAVSGNVMTGAPTTVSNDLNAMAIGPSASASGDYALAVGAGAGAARAGSTAIGARVAALGVDTTVIGYSASTGFDADRAVSIGYMSAADGADSLALGSMSMALGQRSTAIGVNAQVGDTAADGMALGSNSSVVASGAVALGANSKADRANVVSVGNATLQRQIVNVAAGTADTDAVNVSQLRAAVSAGVPDAVTYDSAAHDAVTLGGAAASAPVRLGNVANGIVDASSHDAINGSQLHGLSASVASALGGDAAVATDGTIVAASYRVGSSVFRNVGDALGNLDGRVASNTSAINDLNVALGNVMNNGVEPRYFHANSTLADSLATGVNSIAIGGGAQAAFENSVALGANAVADRANSVSVGMTGGERQITHVAAGTADTDAVNVAQLKQAGLVDANGRATSAVVYDHAGDQVDYASVTLGQGVAGGTVLHNLANGVLASDAVNLGQLNDVVNQIVNEQTQGATNPFVSVNGDTKTEAAAATGTHATAVGASAVANGDQATALGANAQASGTTATAVGAQAVANGANASAFGAGSQAVANGAVALGAGSIADRANAVSVGQAGGERQIVNVAPGTHGTDAVNLNQLNAAIDQTHQSLHDLDTSTRKGIAAASALQIVTPYLPGRTTLNAGIAGYRGQAALGFGVSRWNEKGTINFNAGVASSGSNSTIVRAGIGIVLGN
ncbi:YadA-like family protein [Paraburkholderia phymatum]|uniref:YadA family autotransporter adhesin n=1 Tax=Paraburkholderia phymatum TaxID=148447 RepID=UPI003171C9A5